MTFLITYDRSSGCLVDEHQFADVDIEAANDARLEAEIAHAGAAAMEVVILRADSREELQKTHARYFKTLKELSPT